MTLVNFRNRPAAKTINSFFDEYFNDFPTSWAKNYNNGSVPPVNIHETADAYLLELSVPGRNKEDIKTTVENGLLTISYEKEPVKNDELKAVRREFSFGNFRRSFTLDQKIDADKIEAKYENGVLKLTLPKKEQAKDVKKQISIQ